ncbi:MAG: sodium:solute symporter [Calditrichales bacterium]|nr:MAG: sodium:solute symporter [Calditrichales bacterium]
METKFFLVDKIILIVYFIGIILMGLYFRKRSNTADGFMIASGRLPSWAVGLSMLGTFISSITFIGYPGQAYNFNWDAFMFSVSLPVAAMVAMLYFIPLYRTKVKVSAYEYLEQRFGGWARVYGSISFMFGSLTRIGMILFLVSLVLHSLTGWDYVPIIILTGIGVTLYTMVGGIEAVIWTDVVQVIILLGGAILTIIILILDLPDGASQIFAIGTQYDKFSLGAWDFDLIAPTAWVVVLYGIMENLRNFGVDQNYVQRYQTTASTKDAVKSVWTAALTYIPVSAMFLFIGTALFAFYTVNPDQLPILLQGEMMGDKIFPHFIVTQLPVGLRGILIAAIVAAAMSSIDSSLNTVSTLTLLDFYKRYWRRGKSSDDAHDIKMLRWYTVIWGIAGTITGLSLIQIKSALETGWQLGGIAGGGVIGLFLLGIGFKWIKRWQAITAVVASVIAIAWATFARDLPAGWQWLECTWNARMIGVIGTITLMGVGLILGIISYRKE